MGATAPFRSQVRTACGSGRVNPQDPPATAGGSDLFSRRSSIFLEIPSNLLDIPSFFLGLPRKLLDIPSFFLEPPSFFLEVPSTFLGSPSKFLGISSNLLGSPRKKLGHFGFPTRSSEKFARNSE